MNEMIEKIAWLIARRIGVTVNSGDLPKSAEELSKAETDIGCVDLIALAQEVHAIIGKS